jgi:hypothetical protein
MATVTKSRNRSKSYRNEFTSLVVDEGMKALQAQGKIRFNKIVYGRISAFFRRGLEAAVAACNPPRGPKAA